MSSTKRPHGIHCAYSKVGNTPNCCPEAITFDATMAERERCAKLAEAAKVFCETQVDGGAYDSVWAARANECYLMAERIREA